MGLFNKLSKITKMVVDEVKKPESFSKGDAFESYIRNSIFVSEYYDLVHKTHSYNENKGDYIESTLYPDFLFRCKKSGKEFYVEAKFRSNFYKDKVEWAKPYQLKRYKVINKSKPVFLCLGLHGKARNPEFIFIIPLKDLKHTGLYESFLSKYNFYNEKPVFPNYLWKLLK